MNEKKEMTQEEKDERDLARILTRLNNLESSLADIQGWRDPKGTQAKLECMANRFEEVERALGARQSDILKLIAEMAKLRGDIIPQPTAKPEEEPNAPVHAGKKGKK